MFPGKYLYYLCFLVNFAALLKRKRGLVGKLSEFRIAFSGLKLGDHEYELSAGNTFFEKYPILEIGQGEVAVNLLITKKERMLIFHFDLNGWVELTCDRCLGKFKHQLKGNETLYVKLQNGIDNMVEESEDVVIIPDDWSEFDVTHFVYEYIAILLPMKKVHGTDANGKSLCDPEMIKILNENKIDEEQAEQEIDPRWEALKKLKNNQ